VSKYRIIDFIRKSAAKERRRIVFSESQDPRILQAAAIISREAIASPVLVGNPKKVQASARSMGLSLSGIDILETDSATTARYAAQQLEGWRSQGTTVIEARRRLEDPVYFAAAMVRAGDADGLVGSGPQPAFKRAAILSVGLESQSLTVSRYFLMALPADRPGRAGAVVFADSGDSGTPTGAHLAAIALAAAANVRRLLKCEPRVAFLSFSPVASLDFKNRFKSAESELHDRVMQASRTLRVRGPGLILDEKLQTDVAFTEDGTTGVPTSCGANTLVFADTEPGNLGHRLAQRVEGARVLGPMFQGLARPANNLPSRYSVEDVVDLTAITAIEAQ